MRGLRTDQTAQTIIAGHAFMQNLPADATNSPSTRPAPNDSPQPFTELTRAT